MSIHIRPATIADKELIIDAIIAAEKSGSAIISYCAIFSITEAELRSVLSNILDEEDARQELCISNFLVAEKDGVSAAALSSWVENETGMSSGFVKSNLLMYFIDRDKIIAATEALKLVKETNIDRMEKALQIECVYTDERFRGLGLAKSLIEEHIKWRKSSGSDFNKVQIILLKNNEAAVKAYSRAGFDIVTEKKCSDPSILNLLSCDTKILMEKNLNT